MFISISILGFGTFEQPMSFIALIDFNPNPASVFRWLDWGIGRGAAGGRGSGCEVLI